MLKEKKDNILPDTDFLVTGDTHGNFARLLELQRTYFKNGQKDVPLVILGDFGVNYYADCRATRAKQYLSENTSFEIFCVHGNHEQNPEYMESCVEKEWNGGVVYYEPDFPKILYAKDGEVYRLGEKTVAVFGGAYSIDKDYRLAYGYNWFPDEQMSEDVRKRCEQNMERAHWKVDYVFSHTVPLSAEPTEFFMDGVDQSKVDKTTEIWLEKIKKKLDYKFWFAGHYHCNVKKPGNIEILFYEVKEVRCDGTAETILNIGQ